MSLDDLNTTAGHVFEAARVAAQIRDEALLRLARSQLTTSRQGLIFNYKLAFESMRACGRVVPTEIGSTPRPASGAGRGSFG